MNNLSFLLPATASTDNLVKDTRPIDEGRLADFLNANKLNWTVATEPLFVREKITPFLGVIRTDTDHCFQAVSKVYEPIQNAEFAALALQICDITGSEIEVVKTFDNGALQYITLTGRQFQFNADTAMVGDVVGEKITLINSHNKSRAFCVSFGHLVLSCTNGMTRFDQKGSVNIRHTANGGTKLKEVLNGMRSIMQSSEKMLEGYKQMSKVQVSQDNIQTVWSILADVKANDKVSELSTRKMNISKKVYSTIGEEISYKGQTAWGLLNGATKYTSQLAGKSDNSLKSKMFGHNAKKDLTVFNYLMGLTA